MASRKRTLGKGFVGSGFLLRPASFEKISAVEGIEPTEASRRRIQDFERKGLNPEERRREIIDAHRPKR